MTVGEFANKINMLRAIWPISVTSWFRSEQRNINVGGVANSFHRLGLAVDVQFDEGFLVNVSKWNRDLDILDLEAFDEGDHWHIEVKG